MAHVLLSDINAWLEPTKMRVTSIDVSLEQQCSDSVLSRLAQTYDNPNWGVPVWVDQNTTPRLVKSAIAMTYAGWAYDRQYSEMVAAEGNSYGVMLRQEADILCAGIADSSILLIDLPPQDTPAVAPVFYPTDASSTTDAQMANTDPDDHSIGPAAFGMFKVF